MLFKTPVRPFPVRQAELALLIRSVARDIALGVPELTSTYLASFVLHERMAIRLRATRTFAEY